MSNGHDACGAPNTIKSVEIKIRKRFFSSCIAIYLLMVCQGWMLNPLVFFKACKFRRCRVMWCYHGVTVVGIHCWIRKYIFLNKTWSLNSLNQLIRSALWTMLFSTPWTLWAKGEPWYLARDSFPLNKTTVFRNSVDSFDVVAQRLCTESNFTFWLVV